MEDDNYVFARGPRDEIWLNRDLVIVKAGVEGGQWELTDPPRIDWPLTIGKKGVGTAHLKAPYGSPGTANVSWEVKGYEDIDVPAGRFKAFRIDFNVEILRPTNFTRRAGYEQSSWNYSVWYAPEIRQLVKAAGDRAFRFEVVAVDPEESSPLEIVIHEPADQAVFLPSDGPSVRAKVSGGKGVSRVVFTLNGVTTHSEVAKGDPKRVVLVDDWVKGLREGKNVFIVSATDPTGKTTQAARILYVLPPVKVDLTQHPDEKLRVDVPYVVVTARIGDPKGDWVLFFLNGFQKAWSKYPAGEAETTVEWPATLDAGENDIALEVRTSDGARRRIERKIVFVPSGPPAGVLTTIPEAGTTASAPDKPIRPEATPPATAATTAAPSTPSLPVVKPPEPPVAPGAEPKPAPAEVAALPPATVPPLRISLTSPREQARFEQDSAMLTGMVSGGGGVSRVLVTLNGVEVSRHQEPTPQASFPLTLTIKLREGQNTVVVTATDADGVIHQDLRTVHYDKSVPLSVAFRYPADQARVADASSVAAGVITSSKGVANARVTLNGQEVHHEAGRPPQKSILLTVPLTLREGPNTITLTATDVDGTVKEEARTVIFEKPAAVAAVPAVRLPPGTPDRWAVVIGVGRYDSPDIPKLLYSVSDAEAIYNVLTGPGGFKKDRVLLLTDKTEKRPTYRNLKWALGTFLARSAKKDDTVLIFFAGHGAPEVDQRGVERDGLAKYLVPSDAEPDDLYSTALPMDELQTIFARIEAERVIAFLDSCYSGAAGGRTFSSKRTRTSQLDDLFLERLTRSKGRAILTASRPAEVSIELPELGHGIFTYFLVQGLRGAADLNRDEIVTLQELYEYVEQQVAQKSRAVGGNQHPMMKGELEGLLPLMRVSGR